MPRTRDALVALVALVACDARGPAPEPPPRTPSSVRAEETARAAPAKSDTPGIAVRTRWPSPERLVAVGDLHGDLSATRRVLALAGVAKDGRWIGGKTLLVQTGDVLDRGDGERAILDLLEALGTEARAAGGDVVVLNGNHELMNAAGDFRYVTPGGFAEFESAHGEHAHPAVARMPEPQRARASALFPGGRYAMRLATHPVVAVVGDTVFVHGGLLSKWADDLERLNAEVSSWLAGGASDGMRVLAAEDGPVWSRRYAERPDEEGCAELGRALAKVGAKRMVVGHTVMSQGIAPACDERLWRIDVGMASAYGGRPEALEITKDGLRVLR